LEAPVVEIVTSTCFGGAVTISFSEEPRTQYFSGLVEQIQTHHVDLVVLHHEALLSV
jgi:hypothetical protein